MKWDSRDLSAFCRGTNGFRRFVRGGNKYKYAKVESPLGFGCSISDEYGLILDARSREPMAEELHRLTLVRIGTLVSQV